MLPHFKFVILLTTYGIISVLSGDDGIKWSDFKWRSRVPRATPQRPLRPRTFRYSMFHTDPEEDIAPVQQKVMYYSPENYISSTVQTNYQYGNLPTLQEASRPSNPNFKVTLTTGEPAQMNETLRRLFTSDAANAARTIFAQTSSLRTSPVSVTIPLQQNTVDANVDPGQQKHNLYGKPPFRSPGYGNQSPTTNQGTMNPTGTFQRLFSKLGDPSLTLVGRQSQPASPVALNPSNSYPSYDKMGGDNLLPENNPFGNTDNHLKTDPTTSQFFCGPCNPNRAESNDVTEGPVVCGPCKPSTLNSIHAVPQNQSNVNSTPEIKDPSKIKSSIVFLTPEMANDLQKHYEHIGEPNRLQRASPQSILNDSISNIQQETPIISPVLSQAHSKFIPAVPGTIRSDNDEWSPITVAKQLVPPNLKQSDNPTQFISRVPGGINLNTSTQPESLTQGTVNNDTRREEFFSKIGGVENSTTADPLRNTGTQQKSSTSKTLVNSSDLKAQHSNIQHLAGDWKPDKSQPSQLKQSKLQANDSLTQRQASIIGDDEIIGNLVASMNRKSQSKDESSTSTPVQVPDYVPVDNYSEVEPIGYNKLQVQVIRKDVLQKINFYRTFSGTLNLEAMNENEQLHKYAQARANDMAKAKPENCQPATPSTFGENVFCGRPCMFIGELIVDLWAYDARLLKENESEDSLRANKSASNFLQLSWRRTKEIGVGAAMDDVGTVYIVTEFNPPKDSVKNYSYADNIPKYSKALIDWGAMMRKAIDDKNGLQTVKMPEGEGKTLSMVPGWNTEQNKTKILPLKTSGL